MSSKYLVLLFLILSSCSWWGGDEENKANSKVARISSDIFGDSGDCLSEIDDFFIKYFKGITTKFDISKSVMCVEDSLELLFKNTLERDDKTGFTKKELFNILSKVWNNKDKKSVKKNIEILFLVKRLLVGGTQKGFTREDLKRFLEELPEIHKLLLEANVHIRYWLYSLEDDVDLKKESLDKVSTVMTKLDALRGKFQADFSKQESYDLLEIIFGGESLVKYKELIFIASDVVFGDETAFKVSQSTLFERIHLTLEAQSTVRSARFPRGLFFGDGMSIVFKGLHKAFSSLNEWSNLDEKYYIPTNKIHDVIAEIYKLNGDEREVNPFAVTATRLLERYFKVGKNGKLRTESFSKSLHTLKTWYSGQQEIINNYNPKGVNFSFKGYVFSEKEIMQSLLILDTLKETEKSYFLRKPDGTTQYIYNRGERSELTDDVNYYDLSLKNLFANVAYRAYEAYVSDNSTGPIKKVNASLTKLRELILDIRPLAIDMGIANPYSCAAADNFMMEANLFTTAGNGDEELSFIEGLELVFMSYSAGSLSKKVYGALGESCNLEGMKFLGNSFMDRQCVRKNIFGSRNILLSNFSEFIKYHGIIETPTSRKDWDHRLGWAGVAPWWNNETTPENIKDVMMSIVNGCKDPEMPMTKQELQTIVGLTQYIENWFSIYDTTGQRSLWTAYIWDEQDLDYIIDGREANKLFDEKLAPTFNKNFVTSDYKSLRWLGGKIKRGLLKGFLLRTESGEAMDRYRAFSLLQTIIDSLRGKKPHSFQNKFCKNIVSSYKEKRPIEFDNSLILRCDGTDSALKKDLPPSQL